MAKNPYEFAKEPLPRAGPLPDSEPAQQPELPVLPYKPYTEEPGAPEPYRPYAEKPAPSEPPYEPYKGM
ncbi:MAG: hypothetical protein WA485_14595 [Candidatus Sulfotelmatobacter sp.]